MRFTAIWSSALFSLLVLAATATRAEDKPIASTATADGKARVDILSLRRTEGDTVTLRFTLTDDGDTDFSMVLGNMRLIDLVNRRSYSPGLMSPYCSAAAGKQVVCWAVFGAPPPATNKLNVQFYEHLDLVAGVPVTG